MNPPTRREALACSAAALWSWLPCWARAAGPASPGETVRWPAVTLLDGTPWGAQQHQGRAVVVVFFSTTCPYCTRHNAHVQRLHEASRRLPLVVLAAALDTDPAAVRDYLARHGHGFAVTLAHAPLRAALSERRVIPLTCVVDRTGVLREVIPGEMFEEDVLQLARWAAPPKPAAGVAA